MRGQRAKRAADEKSQEERIVRKNAPTWAMLIKCIFEVDPLKCPDCGEKMRIISFIEREQKEVIEPSDAKLYMAFASLKEPA